MSPGTLALPAALAFTAALLAWYLARVDGHWGAKTALFALTTLVVLASWIALPTFMGWPSRERPAGKTEILWITVNEPDPSSSTPGNIYFWTLPYDERHIRDGPLLGYRPPGVEPRAYRLPYTRRMHEAAMKLKQRLAAGERMIMELPEGGDIDGDGDGERGESYGGERTEPHFYELPPPALPAKDGKDS